MVCLEMISIRTAGIIEAGKVCEICRQMFQSIADAKPLKLTVLCNARYATDISIHLQWKSDSGVGEHFGQANVFGARRSRTDKPHVVD